MHVKSWCFAKPITFCRCRCRPRFLSPLIFNILVTDSSFCFFSRFLLFYFVWFGLQGSAVSSSTFRTFQAQSQIHKKPSLRPGLALGERRQEKKGKKHGESQNIGLNSLAEFLLLLLFNYVFCLFCLSTWEPDSRPKLTLNNKVDTTSQKSVVCRTDVLETRSFLCFNFCSKDVSPSNFNSKVFSGYFKL